MLQNLLFDRRITIEVNLPQSAEVHQKFAARGKVPQVNEASARARLERLLHEQLDAGERDRLMAEGATMTEEDACRLALVS